MRLVSMFKDEEMVRGTASPALSSLSRRHYVWILSGRWSHLHCQRRLDHCAAHDGYKVRDLGRPFVLHISLALKKTPSRPGILQAQYHYPSLTTARAPIHTATDNAVRRTLFARAHAHGNE